MPGAFNSLLSPANPWGTQKKLQGEAGFMHNTAAPSVSFRLEFEGWRRNHSSSKKKKKKSAWGITVYWALSLPLLFLVFTPILGSTGRGVFFFSVSLMRNLRVREETRLSQDDSPCKGSRRWEPQLLVPILCLFHLAHHSANHAVISWEHRSWTSRCCEMESTGLPPREHLTVSLGIGMSKSVITIKSLII